MESKKKKQWRQDEGNKEKELKVREGKMEGHTTGKWKMRKG